MSKTEAVGFPAEEPILQVGELYISVNWMQ